MATDPLSVVVPLTQLNALLSGLRVYDGEKCELLEKLEERRQRVQTLKQRTEQVELKLAQYKSDNRQSLLSPLHSLTYFSNSTRSVQSPPSSLLSASSVHHSSSHSIKRPPPLTAVVSSVSPPSPTARIGHVLLMRERVSQLEDVVASVKEISAQGDFDDVVARTLGAAQKLVRADKYTLGLFNERRNLVELFSVGPQQRPHDHLSSPTQRTKTHSALPFVREGVVAADSATTFARVIMTGKPLAIADFATHENYDAQIKASGLAPHALFCLPIRNAHCAIVGVFQVFSTNRQAPSGASTSTNTRIATDLSAANAGAKSQSLTASRSFTDADKQSLAFLAVVAGSAIWNLILVRERQTAQSRIEGLLKLHRNISMEAVSSAVLDQVLAVCHELLGTERIGLFLKMDGEDELYIACAADIVRGEYVPLSKGIVGYVARTGETVITNDAYAHPRFDPTLDQKTGFVTRRVLCLAVRSPDGAILAVLSAVNKVDNTDFSSEDAVFLAYAADAVGISLHKASLHHEVKTAQKLIEARLRLTTFVSESANIEAFVDLVMEIGKDIMACDRFGLLLIDHFKKELWITPRVGGESIRTPMNRGISGLVASTGTTVCTRDAYKHALFDPSVDVRTGYRTTSVLCMPIFEDHAVSTPKCVAVAMCINKMEGAHVVAFTATDRSVLDKYAREVQFALGRLSLDISYYKVVSDCTTTVVDNSGSVGDSDGLSSSRRSSSSTMRVDHYSETDIISSIVHKYCNSGPHAGAGDTDSNNGSKTVGSHTSMSLLAVVPALLRKKMEDDDVPFPRPITFARGSQNEPLEQWDFDTLTLSTSDVSRLCMAVFRAYGFLDAFRISSDKFAAFTANVANYYRTNPFHNLQHALQVVLAVHTIVRCECRKFFSGVEIFAMLVAALCHDIDHPSTTNDFELKTLSPLALTHNDDAVLERHHCRVTFIILNHKSAKILQHLDTVRSRRVRRLIIDCILATDMAKHFDKCKALEALSRRQLSEKRELLMGILLHAADLSFHTLPFRQASEWSSRLLDEFQGQATSEAEHGVATDFFMQGLERRTTRLVVQLNYINYVVRPIWLPLTSLCHHLRFYTDSLELNFDLYHQQLDDETKNATETLSQPKNASTATVRSTGPPLVSSDVPSHVGASSE